MEINAFQKLINQLYGEKDKKRGCFGTFTWFSEEVGELARGLLGKTTPQNLAEEFADVAAWLFSLASLMEVDMEAAIKEKYLGGCPKCQKKPCGCKE